jgi:predicted aminopeptidase
LYFIVAGLLSGCANFTYYVDTINGHYALLEKSQPIDALLADEVPAELREKLENLRQAREFASRELLLPDNDSYKSYADIGRPYATWNVIATPRLSVKPRQWCFLVVGCISYRGYFSKQKAEAYAYQLQQQGYDTYVTGSRAYSTLGWFDDPLLNTMMYQSEARWVGILFHELAHQKLYIEGDSAFNEAFATAIEQEGIRRWFVSTNKENLVQQYLPDHRRREQFNALLKTTRARLSDLFKSDKPESEKLELKKKLFADLKNNYWELKKTWSGYSGYDQWMSQDLNNAHLAIVATYHDLVPGFKRILEESNYELNAFYKKIEMLITDHESDHRDITQTLLAHE